MCLLLRLACGVGENPAEGTDLPIHGTYSRVSDG